MLDGSLEVGLGLARIAGEVERAREHMGVLRIDHDPMHDGDSLDLVPAEVELAENADQLGTGEVVVCRRRAQQAQLVPAERRVIELPHQAFPRLYELEGAQTRHRLDPSDVAWKVSIFNGQLQVHDRLGKLIFSSGGPLQSAALAKITVKPSGAIVMSSELGAVQFEQNKTGFRLKTAAGEFSLDTAGTVKMGPKVALGNVLTTTSMPVDLTTGVPTTGSPSVQAGMIGVGTPGPAAVPSLFLPDAT